MSQAKVSIPKIVAILILSILPALILIASTWICDVEYQTARGKLEAATITKFSIYELVYIDKNGKPRATTDEKEYRAAVRSFY